LALAARLGDARYPSDEVEWALRVSVRAASLEPRDATILSLDLDLQPANYFEQLADLFVKVLMFESGDVEVEGR
jgi:hypothetical protein